MKVEPSIDAQSILSCAVANVVPCFARVMKLFHALTTKTHLKPVWRRMSPAA